MDTQIIRDIAEDAKALQAALLAAGFHSVTEIVARKTRDNIKRAQYGGLELAGTQNQTLEDYGPRDPGGPRHPVRESDTPLG